MKRTKESNMCGQTKLFFSGFSRGRGGNQPEPNPSFSGSSEQIRKPSSSKELTSSPLDEEQRSRSQSVTAHSSIPGFDTRRLLARTDAGEGVSDSDKLAYLKNGNGAIYRSFPFPKHFLNGCQRQFMAKRLDEYQWLTYSASEDGGFCVPCALFDSNGLPATHPWLCSGSLTLW